MDFSSALITGGSRGLGAALAARLAARGTRVALVAREAAPLEALCARIRDGGGVAHAIAADVARKDQTHRIAQAAAALVGPIDLLVQNASTLGPTPLPLLLDTECEDLSSVLETNLIGPFRLAKAIAGAMALRGCGTILQITSDASIEAYPRWGSYAISKAALDHLGRLLAVELGPRGVRVLTIDPGEMDTRMHADAMPEADRAALPSPDAAARRVLARLDDGSVAGGARVVA